MNSRSKRLARRLQRQAVAPPRRLAPRDRHRRERAVQEREVAAPPIVSPGTMMISRSMTFRSSRTLPGHGYACRAATALASSVFGRRPYSPREAGHEVLGEQRDVVARVAQRRDEDRDDVQPEVQVLAEAARRGSRPAVPCWSRRAPARPPGRRTCRRPARRPAPAARAAPSPASSGSCRRSRRGRSCPPSATSNFPRRSPTAPVNAPLHVAEQLALDQLLGDGRAVHLDERARAPPAQRVDRSARPAPCPSRSRRRSARGRWSAPPWPPARAAAAWRSSRPPSAGGGPRGRAAPGSRPRAAAAAGRCARRASSCRATAASR